ncbi:MAG: sulfatase-like hydrolase/transferase [Acidimicrobiales bacterium]
MSSRGEALGATTAVAAPRPNVLLIMSDDQSYETWGRGLMPTVFSEVVDQGVSFDRAYVNDSLCCPSRVQTLTGLFEHHTGIDNQVTRMLRPTLVHALHDNGYRTSLTGKYLNSETCDPRAEFDQWVCSSAPPSDYSLVDPFLNVNGTWTERTGYTADILADYTTSFIASTPVDQPFFALYTPTSPHLPADDPRCASIPIAPNRPPSYNEDTTSSGKPAYMVRGPLGPAEVAQFDNQHEVMTQAAMCLDGAVASLLAGLGDRAQDTIVIYMSDNGYLYGEHGRNAKKLPYEEAVHVPFVIRYPALVPTTAPFSSAALVGNVDLAPTIAELAGIEWNADGSSLVPLLTGEAATLRDAYPVEGCQGAQYPCDPNTLQFVQSEPPSYFAIVEDRYKYTEYLTGEVELYDLLLDPYELVNLHGQPEAAEVEATLAARLELERAPAPPDTTIVTGPSGAISTRLPAFTFFGKSFRSRFECRVTSNGQLGAWTRCDDGSFVPAALVDGTHLIEVRATDETGATDPSPAARTVTVSAAGPNVSLTSGPSGITKTKRATFKFKSTTPGVTFECRTGVLGSPGAWTPCTSPTVYSNLADAKRVFEVRSIDGGGTPSSVPGARSWTVDHTGPVFSFLDAPVPQTRAPDEQFVFYADESLGGPVTCTVDSQVPVDCSTGYLAVTGMTEGSHTLAVTATNTLALAKTTTKTWKVDRTPPVMSVGATVPNGSVTSSTSIQFTISANEPLDADRGRNCALDGSNVLVGKCASTTTFYGLAPGVHTFSLQGYDKAWNSSTPTTWTWTVL